MSDNNAVQSFYDFEEIESTEVETLDDVIQNRDFAIFYKGRIIHTGNSLAVTVPLKLLQNLHWFEGTTVRIRVELGCLICSKK